MSDKVGAGSEDWDEKAKALICVRESAKVSVKDMLVGNVGKASMSRFWILETGAITNRLQMA